MKSLTNNDIIMSVATTSIENSFQGILPSEPISMEAALLPQSLDPDTIARFNKSIDLLQFSGKLVIPEALFKMPEQTYRAAFHEFGAIFENDPTDSWPKITIQFATGLPLRASKAKEFFVNFESHEIRDFRVRPSGDTVDAEVLYTRVMYALYEAGRCSIEADGVGRLFGLRFDPPSPSDLQQLLYRAKLYRKLKFIETKFNRKFLLPTNISPDAVRLIEIIFRGITEGEFSIRSSDITFVDVPAVEINLAAPPFSSIGQFSNGVGQDVILFGQHLPTGPVTVTIRKAALANPRLAKKIQEESNGKGNIRFEVLDNQIIHRFERYARLSGKHRIPRLTKFKFGLSLVESKDLVALVDEPLQGDVTHSEASQLAMGWTLYNDLPDRYCPQEPEVDPSTGHWRVPIYLVYTNGEGGPVGELLIHKKTGVILSQTPVEEMRGKAMALAKKILHAG